MKSEFKKWGEVVRLKLKFSALRAFTLTEVVVALLILSSLVFLLHPGISLAGQLDTLYAISVLESFSATSNFKKSGKISDVLSYDDIKFLNYKDKEFKAEFKTGSSRTFVKVCVGKGCVIKEFFGVELH